MPPAAEQMHLLFQSNFYNILTHFGWYYINMVDISTAGIIRPYCFKATWGNAVTVNRDHYHGMLENLLERIDWVYNTFDPRTWPSPISTYLKSNPTSHRQLADIVKANIVYHIQICWTRKCRIKLFRTIKVS